MTLDDLETQAALGEDVERLLANPLVKDCVQSHLDGLRAQILDLGADQTAAFTRQKAGLEAVREFLSGLETVAELGRQARLKLASPPENPNDRRRVL